MAPETAYHYAVLARSANGEGAQSDIISATTPAAPKSKEQPRRSGARQDTPIPPVILVSNLSQPANQNATYSRDHGQAFTTGNNSTGYSVTSVTIVSKDPNNDAIPLQICEVDGSVHPTTVCTDLTPPSSYPQGNLTYTAPTSPVLTLDADTTYMLVFKAPPSGLLRVAATSSDGEDAASLTGFLNCQRIPVVQHQQHLGDSATSAERFSSPSPAKSIKPPRRPPASRQPPEGATRSTSPGRRRTAPAAPTSPATRSNHPPMPAPTGATSSPTPATPTPLTSTPAFPAETPATTGSPPSTRSAPAPPPTPPTQPPPR